MKGLTSPASVAVLAVVAAFLAHPSFELDPLDDAYRLAVPLVAAVLVSALVARAILVRRLSDAVLALGALLSVLGIAYDSARGHAGRMVLRAERGARSFEEQGRGGRLLGLRPLGFDLTLERLGAAEASFGVALPASKHPMRLSPGNAVSEGPLRLSWVERLSTPRLTIGVHGPAGGGTEVELTPEASSIVGALEIKVEKYFADFALDAANQPFSRSSEPHNPAALLRVLRGGQEWRVFVLRAMPDIHKIPDLGSTFSLKGVSVDDSVVVGVHQEPAAPLVALGVALCALALLLGSRE